MGAPYRRKREGLGEDIFSGRGQTGGLHNWTQVLWKWAGVLRQVTDTGHPLNIGTDRAGKRQTSRSPARGLGLGDPRLQLGWVQSSLG